MEESINGNTIMKEIQSLGPCQKEENHADGEINGSTISLKPYNLFHRITDRDFCKMENKNDALIEISVFLRNAIHGWNQSPPRKKHKEIHNQWQRSR